MNVRLAGELWQRLRQAELVTGGLPAEAGSEAPWSVRVMLGVAGWIGSLFLLGFVGVGFAFVMENAAAAFVVGTLASGGALVLFCRRGDSDFFVQFGLAIGLAGQMLLIYGLYKLLERQESLFFAAVCLVEVLLTVLMPNFVYRVMTSLAAAMALGFSLDSAGAYGIASGVMATGFVLIWLRDVHWGRFAATCRPAGYGFALALLFERGGLLWGHELWWHTPRGTNWLLLYAPWLGKVLVLSVFAVVVFVLLRRLGIALPGRSGLAVIAAATLVMAASFQAPGLAPSLLILLVGFAVANRVLTGLGLLAFGGFLSNYYYLMQETLLTKSLLLLGLGALLLLGRLAVCCWLPRASAGGSVDA